MAWVDEFDTMNSRWDWSYGTGAGYNRIAVIEGRTVADIGVTAAASSSSYSDCDLHLQPGQFSLSGGTFEATVRCTDDNGETTPGKGTRGWGFWNGVMAGSAAWFMSMSPESDAQFVGLRMIVARNGVPYYNQRFYVDSKQWHEYRVDTSGSGTVFYVDGVEMGRTSQSPQSSGMRLHLWLDNYRIRIVGGQQQVTYLDYDHDQAMYIDRAAYYEQVQPPPTPGDEYQLSVSSSPVNVTAQVDGAPYNTPFQLQLAAGSHTLSVPASVTLAGTDYDFASWSDGNTNPSRTINLQSNLSLTANYQAVSPPPPPTRDWDQVFAPLHALGRVCGTFCGWDQQGAIIRNASQFVAAAFRQPFTDAIIWFSDETQAMDNASYIEAIAQRVPDGCRLWLSVSWELFEPEEDWPQIEQYWRQLAPYESVFAIGINNEYSPATGLTEAQVQAEMDHLIALADELSKVPFLHIVLGSSAWGQSGRNFAEKMVVLCHSNYPHYDTAGQDNATTLVNQIMNARYDPPRNGIEGGSSGYWGAGPSPYEDGTDIWKERHFRRVVDLFQTGTPIERAWALFLAMEHPDQDLPGLVDEMDNTWLAKGEPPPPPPDQYQLTISSSPVSVNLTVDGTPYATPFTLQLTAGSHSLSAPATVVSGGTEYDFLNWSDGSTSRSRTINLQSNLSLTANYQAVSPPPPPPGQVLAMYGNSITNITPGQREYALLCKEYYEALGWTVHEEGISGATSESIANHVESTAGSLRPDIATVMMGVNDVQAIAGVAWRQPWSAVPAEYQPSAYRARVERIVNALKNANPQVRVILISETVMTRDYTQRAWPYMVPQPPTLQYPANHHTYYQAAYDDVMEDYAATHSGVEYCNVKEPMYDDWDAFAESHGWTEDNSSFNQEINDYMQDSGGIHPNDHGHSIIFSTLSNQIDGGDGMVEYTLLAGSEPISLTVAEAPDVTPPVITGFTMLPTAPLTTDVVTASFTVTDNKAVSYVRLTLDGATVQSWTPNLASFSMQNVAVGTTAAGSHVLALHAEDSAENYDDAQISFTTTGPVPPDTTPPVIASFTMLPTEPLTGDTVTASFTVTDDRNVAYVRLSLDGGTIRTWAPDTTSFSRQNVTVGTTTQGDHVLALYAEDSAGNYDEDQISFTTTPPVQYWTLSINSTPIAVRVQIDGTAYDTPYSQQLAARTYQIQVPTTLTHNGDRYDFVDWSDGDTRALRSINLTANTSLTARYTLVAAPPAPTNLRVTAASPSAISIAWDAVQNAEGYTVYRSDAPGGPFSALDTTPSTAYTDTQVATGATYYYSVTATVAGMESAFSDPVQATASEEPPPPPEKPVPWGVIGILAGTAAVVGVAAASSGKKPKVPRRTKKKR